MTGQTILAPPARPPTDHYPTPPEAVRALLAVEAFSGDIHRLRCYVLIGYPKDNFEAAEARLNRVKGVGFTPMAMLWRPTTLAEQKYTPGPEWRRLQRSWARPEIIHAGAMP